MRANLGTRQKDNNRQGCRELAAAEGQQLQKANSCCWLGGIIHWYVQGCVRGQRPSFTTWTNLLSCSTLIHPNDTTEILSAQPVESKNPYPAVQLFETSNSQLQNGTMT